MSLSSSLLLLAKTITHPAARSLCDSWASWLSFMAHPQNGWTQFSVCLRGWGNLIYANKCFRGGNRKIKVPVWNLNFLFLFYSSPLLPLPLLSLVFLIPFESFSCPWRSPPQIQLWIESSHRERCELSSPSRSQRSAADRRFLGHSELKITIPVIALLHKYSDYYEYIVIRISPAKNWYGISQERRGDFSNRPKNVIPSHFQPWLYSEMFHVTMCSAPSVTTAAADAHIIISDSRNNHSSASVSRTARLSAGATWRM